MPFTHSQGAHTGSSSANSLSVVLTSNPVAGNVVCVGLIVASTISALSVSDSNSNTYTVTPSSPFNAAAGTVALAYIVAPSNATKTINLSWTATATFCAAWAEEFTVSGGTPSFDKDATGSGSTGTAINSPSISPTGNGELLWATANPGSTITAPAADATAGVWTGAHGGIDSTTGAMSEYDLSSSGSVAVNFTQSPSSNWTAMSMAFKISTPTVTDSDADNNRWIGDPNPQSVRQHLFETDGQQPTFGADAQAIFCVPQYEPHLEHPNLQSPRWMYDGIYEDEVIQIFLPAPAWDTDADQQLTQIPSFHTDAIGNEEWTQLIIIATPPPKTPFDTDSADQQFQAAWAHGAEEPADWTEFIILPPFVDVIEDIGSDEDA